MMTDKKRIAVFASGSGSNFQALAEAVKTNTLPADIALLVCDNPQAFAVQRAEKLEIPVFSFYPKEYPSKQAFETEVVNRLKEANVDFIVLAGYMRLIGPTLLAAFPNKIVNIHPSLLPAFPGKNAVGQAIEAGVKITGVTIHFVDEGMDTGPIIEQDSVRVTPVDTIDTLQAKIQRVEHELYPKVIARILTETSKKEEEAVK
ncbi:MAG TPA: phosphoribosylglycinamide formyltransferase [Chondromyces sp.]|nr:phosphoribosylglycinamide formyltransferase [Chondromyces sp.]